MEVGKSINNAVENRIVLNIGGDYMKECENCKVAMIDNAEIIGQHLAEAGRDAISNIYVSYVDGVKEVKGLFGKVKEEENHCFFNVKARVCPKCGKVELYVDFEEK